MNLNEPVSYREMRKQHDINRGQGIIVDLNYLLMESAFLPKPYKKDFIQKIRLLLDKAEAKIGDCEPEDTFQLINQQEWYRQLYGDEYADL